MTTHSNILAWRIPWTSSLVSYSPWGHQESDLTQQLNSNMTLKEWTVGLRKYEASSTQDSTDTEILAKSKYELANNDHSFMPL